MLILQMKIFPYMVVSFMMIGILSVKADAQIQKYSVEQFGVSSGLSSQDVFSIYQDSKGFLWFSTINGLDRYDGYTFTSYKYPVNSKIVAIFLPGTISEDKEGHIWTFSLNGGVEDFDPEKLTFTNYLPDSSKLPTDYTNSVLTVYVDRNDMIWLGTVHGLYRFDKKNKRFKGYAHTENDSFSLGQNNVNGIYEDKSGTLWLATGGGLDRFDRKTERFYHYWHYPNNPWGDPKTGMHWLHGITEDNNGIFWIASAGGLLKFDRRTGKFELFQHDTSMPDAFGRNVIMSLCADNSGRIWLATTDGLEAFDTSKKTFIDFRSNDSGMKILGHEFLVPIMIDRSGTLWAGTQSDGVFKINITGTDFKLYTNALGTGKEFPMDSVYWFSEQKNGNIWVGTLEGYCLWNARTNKILSEYSLGDIKDVYKGKNEIYVFAGTGGLLKYKLGNNNGEWYVDNTNYTYSKNFTSMAVGRDGKIWVGNIAGKLFSVDEETKMVENAAEIRGAIYSIYQDTYGLVWFGGISSGLFCYDPKTKTVKEYSSNPNDSTTTIDNTFITGFEDKKGNLWLGCYTGIEKFNRSNDKFTRYYGNNDFLKEYVRDIIEDDNGNLWISSGQGITKFNVQTGQFKDYYSAWYFPGITFDRMAGLKADDGEIYLGGTNGFIRFYPDSIKDDNFIPPIAITAFKKFNKNYPFGKEIELNYDDNFLTFEFSALSFIHNEENQYAYRMEGVDKDWVYCGTRRFASYPDMHPGTYVFRVKGCSSDRVWNEAGASVIIHILPPWWKTWWAYSLYILFGLGLLYSLRRYELNRINLKNKVQLDEVKLREREETDRMKSDFFANISHEFRTPLTLIIGPAEKIEKNQSSNPAKDAGIITRNSKRLLQLVNQLLDLSRLDSGRLKLEASPGNIVSFVKGLALSFESFSESRDIMLNIIAEKEFIELYFDREKMVKVLSNLLSNAFKFSPVRGKVIININELPQNVTSIRIRNTGVAIPQKDLPKLFDRFYQVDSSRTKEYEGTGIGLALVKELVELHHGNITVESREADPQKPLSSWVEFTIALPLGRDHLSDDEILSDDKKVILDETFLEDEDFTDPNSIIVPGSGNNGNKTTILIVEDNYDMRGYIKESLSDTYHIEEAVNGEQGIRIAEDIIPDLIISDLMMPKMDGIQLAEVLKNDERTSHIPIIILTAKSGQENKIEGLQTGADDYLTKPFDLQELRVKIENLISIRIKLREKYSRGDFLLKSGGRNHNTLDEKFLARVLEVIEKHLQEEDFSIEECSNEVGMSRANLHKKLKALVGKTPSQYVRSVRLYHARQMIEEKRGNISEVAYSVGFSTPAYFSKCFKDEFGYTPREILS